MIKKWAEKNFLNFFLIFRKKYDIVYNRYTEVKIHKKLNCNFFFEKNVHFEVGFFLIKKWAEKNFLNFFLIFRKKYDIVYNRYTEVKIHKKLNCNFFFEKNVHFEVGFFLIKKWAEKNFLNFFLIFRKKYDIVYNRYTEVKIHKKLNCNFFFEKNVHFEVGFFLIKKWAEKNFLNFFLIFRKKYDIVYNRYTEVKIHKKLNCNFFFEKNVHFEVGFFLIKKWAEKNFLNFFLIFRKKYDIVYNRYTEVKIHKKLNCNFFFEKNVHFEVGFFLIKKWAEKNFLNFFLIFRKKYDIVYNRYTEVKIHKKLNCNFFFEKNVHFEVGFFLIKKWAEKIF